MGMATATGTRSHMMTARVAQAVLEGTAAGAVAVGVAVALRLVAGMRLSHSRSPSAVVAATLLPAATPRTCRCRCPTVTRLQQQRRSVVQSVVHVEAAAAVVACTQPLPLPRRLRLQGALRRLKLP